MKEASKNCQAHIQARYLSGLWPCQRPGALWRQRLCNAASGPGLCVQCSVRQCNAVSGSAMQCQALASANTPKAAPPASGLLTSGPQPPEAAYGA